MRALVTGASGFIGGHVVEALVREGHEVRALVRPTSDTSHLASTGATMVVGDITNRASLDDACRGIDWVFHTAAIVGSRGSWSEYYRVGVHGTANVLNAASQASVKRVIHLSSVAVYGARSRPEAVTEEMPFDRRPQRWNHYVREKVLSERLVWRAHERGRVVATTIRPSVVLGPRDRAVVPRLMRVAGTPLAAMVGRGTNHIAVVVVEELAAAIVAAAGIEGAAGRAYNLSSSTRFTQEELLQLFSATSGKPLPTRHVPMTLGIVGAGAMELAYLLARRPSEPPLDRIGVTVLGTESNVDVARARAELGWEGSADVKAAVRRSVDSYLGAV